MIDYSPKDTVVFLNSKVGALFECISSAADYTTWKVNETVLSELDIDGLVFDHDGVGGNGLFTLTIPAKAVYNGTTVQCVTGRFGGVPVESEISTLKIQGIRYCHTCIHTE